MAGIIVDRIESDTKEIIAAELKRAATEYITPQSVRKVLRNPRVEVAAESVQVPFGAGMISVRMWGAGERVLLVHGWSANQIDMFGYVPEVVSRGMQAIVVDLPAHGSSSGVVAGLDELGRAVLAVGQHLGPLKGLIAHSIGGAASQLAMAQGLDVARAVMLASPRDYERSIYRFATRQGYDAEQSEQLFATLESMGVKTRIRSVDFVPQIDTPALIVHSQDDSVVLPDTAVVLANHWRNSTLMMVEGLGHRGVLKDRDLIAKVVDYLLA